MTMEIIPPELAASVKALRFENPSDERLALDDVERSEAFPTTIKWLKALVRRKGERFDHENPSHLAP